MDEPEAWASYIWELLIKNPMMRTKAVEFVTMIESLAATNEVERMAVVAAALIVAHNGCGHMLAPEGAVAELSDHITEWWVRVQIALEKEKGIYQPAPAAFGPN